MKVMDANDFALEPSHIVEVRVSPGHTDFTLRLSQMTWTARLVSLDGELYGLIQDEHDVPLADGQIILDWMIHQPRFIRRIWELSHKHHHGHP
jgi:hypothetical protein